MIIVKELAKKFLERADELGYRGKKRVDGALDYMAGAYVALDMVKHPQANWVGRAGVFLTSTQGISNIETLAKLEDNGGEAEDLAAHQREAAPDMLAALNAFLEAPGHSPGDSFAKARALAIGAVAKANGLTDPFRKAV